MELPRVGLIVPSSNPTIEPYLATSGISEYLGVDFLCTRLRVQRIDVDHGSMAQFAEAEILAAGELLTDAEVDALIWAGTSGFWIGGDPERARMDRVSARLDCPTGSSRDAMLAALAEFEGKRRAVLTPYTPEIHGAVLGDLRSVGYEVTADKALNLSRNLSFAEVPDEEVADHLSKLGAEGDPVALVCTNMLGIQPGLNPDVLVVDSVLATLWFAARMTVSTTLSYRQVLTWARA